MPYACSIFLIWLFLFPLCLFFVSFSHRQNTNWANDTTTMKERQRANFNSKFMANISSNNSLYARLFHCIVTKPYHCTLTRDEYTVHAQTIYEWSSRSWGPWRYFYACFKVLWIECDYIRSYMALGVIFIMSFSLSPILFLFLFLSFAHIKSL